MSAGDLASELAEPIWRPSPEVSGRSRLARYTAQLEAEGRGPFADYEALWRWSIADLEGFWRSIIEACELDVALGSGPALTGVLPDVRWFPGAHLNYAANACRPDRTGPAISARSESRAPSELSFEELRQLVGRARAGLLARGVQRGDRVAAYLPNIPEAVVAMLACASIGAVWSSCSPEFGVDAVVDRFGQLDPVVLICADGYTYGGRRIRRAAEAAQLCAALPSVRTTVAVSLLGEDPVAGPGVVTWDELLAAPPDLRHDQVPFEHPLAVLYSSGTTGKPKAIVHAHGGILVEHAKYLALHHDLGPGDRFLWFTTTGWMMWNLLVSGLVTGATIHLFDGDPMAEGPETLWRLAAADSLTSFGVSAAFLVACQRADVRLADIGAFEALRLIGSTGSPLPAHTHRWLQDQLPAVPIASISGGTDVCTAFVGGAPTVPIWAGEISCRALGAAVASFDEAGRPVIEEQGNLVITEPMPSMPVAFWDDPGDARRRAAYFERFPGVWAHGDWITISKRGTVSISGRSDATLNRGGVRIGTAELYAAVERHPDVRDCLALHLEDPTGGAGELLLVVTTGQALDEGRLADELRALVRSQVSPRHVPDTVVVAAALPRTRTGKRIEVPLKRVLSGTPVDEALDREALDDPEGLDRLLVDLAPFVPDRRPEP